MTSIRILIAACAWVGLLTQELRSQDTGASTGNSPGSATPERDLYNVAAPSVFRVEAGLGHGSGFLVDSTGLIITNDHVVGSAEDVVVYIEPTARVRATVVQRDADADLAVLRVAPRLVAGRRVLPLAESPLQVSPGDRVIALGFPLNQPLTMSAGLVANVRPEAILTDAVVNPGNSGGPILTMDGKVIAVTTFLDQDVRGPGLGGAVTVDRAQALLTAARTSPGTPPDDHAMPAVPLETYRISSLKAVADTIDPLLFTALSTTTMGPFAITVSTPLSQMLSAITTDRRIARDRRKREDKASVPASLRYADLGAKRDWAEYVGDGGTPVVSIKVDPLFGETGGSAFRRGLLSALSGVGGQATVRFQGDVSKVTLRRNGQVIEPLRGGHAPVAVGIENELVDFSDVADFGYYLFDPEIFKPDAPQKAPDITLEIEDLKHPQAKRTEKLEPAVVARLWNDFEPYYQRPGGARPFLRYVMTKSCAVGSGEAAMGGVGGAVGPANPATCTYVVAPPRP
jgi:hypothetical protein